MSSIERYEEILRHVWLEPRSLAQSEWSKQNNPFEFLREIPRAEVKAFVEGKGWSEKTGKKTVQITLRKEPDWAWWEPRYDQPWRRETMRDAAFYGPQMR